MSTFDSSNPTKDWGFPDLLDRPTDLANSTAAPTLLDNVSTAGKVNFILPSKSNFSEFHMFYYKSQS